MKTLLINRHAKSSWAQPGMRDFDRPLNARCLRDAPEMGLILKKQHTQIDVFVSSAANRAQTTARLMAKAYGYPEERMVIDTSYYAAHYTELLKKINRWDDKWETAILFAHNPGLSDLASYLTGQYYSIPTCGIVAIDFELDSWSELSRGLGTERYFDFPKNHAFAQS